MVLVGLVTFGIAMATALLVLFASKLEETAFWIWLVLVCGIAPLFGAVVAYWATSPVRVKVVDASRGIVRLRFRNDEYRRHLAGQDAVSTRSIRG